MKSTLKENFKIFFCFVILCLGMFAEANAQNDSSIAGLNDEHNSNLPQVAFQIGWFSSYNFIETSYNQITRSSRFVIASEVKNSKPKRKYKLSINWNLDATYTSCERDDKTIRQRPQTDSHIAVLVDSSTGRGFVSVWGLFFRESVGYWCSIYQYLCLKLIGLKVNGSVG